MCFCGVCLLFSSQIDLGTNFSARGFNDWKNGFSKFKEHENSINDRNSVATLNERGRLTVRIDEELAEQLEPEINYWKNALHRVVVVVKALASRGTVSYTHL